MDEKKKLAILGVLALVIVGVGAFQFMGGGSAPKTAPAAAPKKVADNPPSADPAPPQNPMALQQLPQRDPFKAESLLALNPTTPAPQPTTPRSVRRKLDPPVGELPPYPIDPSGKLPEQNGFKTAVKPEFGYAVSGVILGSHPAAVFVDAQGSERLVPLGAALDGDSKVVGIEKGAVFVSFKGKTIKISGGNGSEK